MDFRAAVKRDEQPGVGPLIEAIAGKRKRRSSVPCYVGASGDNGLTGPPPPPEEGSPQECAAFGNATSSSTVPIENGQQENDFVRTVGRWGSEWPS